MTAQTPYESLTTVDAVQRALRECREVEIEGGDDEWQELPPDASPERLQALFKWEWKFRAALPERAPVSAGGDAEHRELLGRLVRMEWEAWAREQPNPKASWLTQWSMLSEPEREVDRRIGQRIYNFAIDALATPAPPVGADWVMVRNLAEKWRMMATVDRDGNVFQDGRAMGYELCASDLDGLLAAAPTPAEARGVGDGVRVLVAKWRSGGPDKWCGTPQAYECANELEAALAANKPAGEDAVSSIDYAQQVGYTRQAQAQGSEGVDLCEVARELERVHVAAVICKVASLNGGRTTPYWCGFSLACEEIATRLGLPVDDVTRALEEPTP